MSPLARERVALEQRRAHVRRDLAELPDQVEVGEIDTTTEARLRREYEVELAELDTALAALDADPESADAPASVGTRRAVIGAVILVAGFSAAIVFVGGDTVPSQQGAAAGVDATPRSAPVTGESVEAMELAVAGDPANVGLRLAVADIYFQREDYSPSLSHYLAVLEADPTPQQESIALGRIGWMAFLTDQLDAADEYLSSSLDADPTNVEGKLFLGYLRFVGFDDPAGAIPLLEDVLTHPELSDGLRAEVQQTLDSARTSRDEP